MHKRERDMDRVGARGVTIFEKPIFHDSAFVVRIPILVQFFSSSFIYYRYISLFFIIIYPGILNVSCAIYVQLSEIIYSHLLSYAFLFYIHSCTTRSFR